VHVVPVSSSTQQMGVAPPHQHSLHLHVHVTISPSLFDTPS
jgi:hypothetical protein